MSTAICDLRLGGAPLRLRASRQARRLTLRLDRRGDRLTLTVPRGVSQRRALAWAADHEDWARSMIAAVPANMPLVPGATIPFLGDDHVIAWDAARPRRIEQGDGMILCGGPRDGLEGRILRWLKREALLLLARETIAFAEQLGRPFGKVAVGDPRSRWGSCTARGDIRYSWRLILAPAFVRRATVAHEVTHLAHMNHGQDFYATLAALLGTDPMPARAWLKREGARLHRVGA